MSIDVPLEFESENKIIDIQRFQISLNNINNESPEEFNTSIIGNIKSLNRCLPDYLRANRKGVLDKARSNLAFQSHTDTNSSDKFIKILDEDIENFIKNVELITRDMIDILNKNKDKSLEEQKRILSIHSLRLTLELAKNKGVMQSFIPYDLEDGYHTIHEKILVPLGTPLYTENPSRKNPVYSNKEENINADSVLEELESI